jgi:hypothetical protein
MTDSPTDGKYCNIYVALEYSFSFSVLMSVLAHYYFHELSLTYLVAASSGLNTHSSSH